VSAILKNGNMKVRLAHYLKVRFTKFKNGALVAILKMADM